MIEDFEWDVDTVISELKQYKPTCLACSTRRYSNEGEPTLNQQKLYDTWKTSFCILEDMLRDQVSSFEKAKAEGVQFSIEELAGMEKVHRLFGVN